MSNFAHCPRGGQRGILTNTLEQSKFADKIGSKFLDEFIPLPNVSEEVQIKRIKEAGEDAMTLDNVVYWENERGSHGWCNSETGKVVQWG